MVVLFNAAPKKVKIKDNTMLTLKLNGVIVEHDVDSPLRIIPNVFPSDQPTSFKLGDLKATIRAAAKDPKIKGIHLETGFLGAGWATLKELRGVLAEFKATDKVIVASGDFYSQKAYYLASLADKIWLAPEGMFFFTGLSIRLMYYKRLFEKIGVKPLLFRTGDYKSYGEVFVKEKMSEENRSQLTALVDGLYGHFIHEIAESRKLPVPSLKDMANGLRIRTAEDALAYKLVDALGHVDALKKYVKEKLALKEKEKIHYQSLTAYGVNVKSQTSQPKDKQIAIITMVGELVGDDRGASNNICLKNFLKIIRKVKEDEKIGAVVLRINSPGGAVIPTDKIYQELSLLKQEKPVFASFSDIAASGGYYLAAACNKIFAHNVTVTGSIGVFNFWFDSSKLLDQLHLTTDVVKTSDSADVFNDSAPIWLSTARPLSDNEKDAFQHSVDMMYDNFITKVANARGLSKEAVKAVAGGRVWLGSDAQKHRLVDQQGGLDEAVLAAAEAVGYKEGDYSVVDWPKPKSMLARILEFLKIAEVQPEALMKKVIRDHYPVIGEIEKLKSLSGPQARLPYEIEVS